MNRTRRKSPLQFENAQKRFAIPLSQLKNRAHVALKLLSKTKKHHLTSRTLVNFRFVDDAEMCLWHRDYLGDPTPTDVMAFPMREGKKLNLKEDVLGDVVISVETAKRQAKEFGKKLDEELTLYIIHGVLHLLGYEDTKPAKKKVMDQLQFSLLKQVLEKE